MKINRHFQQPKACPGGREGERKPHHRNGEVKDCLIIWKVIPEEQRQDIEYESLSVPHGDKEMLFAARTWFETDPTPLV